MLCASAMHATALLEVLCHKLVVYRDRPGERSQMVQQWLSATISTKGCA